MFSIKGAARALDKKCLKQHPLNHWSKLKIISQKCVSWCPLPKLIRKFSLALPEIKIEISLNHISLSTGQYIIYSFARIQVSDLGPSLLFYPKQLVVFALTKSIGGVHFRFKGCLAIILMLNFAVLTHGCILPVINTLKTLIGHCILCCM